MSDPESRDDELVEALRRLPHEMAPPSHVAAALATAFPQRATTRIVWRAAVAASLVMAALAAGRVTAPGRGNAASNGQAFAFLLYGGVANGGDDRAAEYGAWAMALRRAGRQVSGERLSDAAWSAGVPAADPLPLRGFFIIRARDSVEALDLARAHPHTRDGTIVVRPIDTP
jgi:hypothetical protein